MRKFIAFSLSLLVLATLLLLAASPTAAATKATTTANAAYPAPFQATPTQKIRLLDPYSPPATNTPFPTVTKSPNPGDVISLNIPVNSWFTYTVHNILDYSWQMTCNWYTDPLYHSGGYQKCRFYMWELFDGWVLHYTLQVEIGGCILETTDLPTVCPVSRNVITVSTQPPYFSKTLGNFTLKSFLPNVRR
jgi:hypothetical protein